MSRATYGFLHIGKTGGTSITKAIEAAEEDGDGRLKILGHSMRLKRLFATTDMSVSFVVRDPIDRFVSVFNSRLRNGRPLYNHIWRTNEAIAFMFFPTANVLAESLDCDDERMVSASRFAVKSIMLMRQNFKFHLSSADFLDRHKDRIYFACDISSIDDNLASILAPLNLNGRSVQSLTQRLHVNPGTTSSSLSEKARANLRRYLSDEYEIYDYCRSNLFRLNL